LPNFLRGFSRESLLEMLMVLPGALIAIVGHELCHGFAAWKLGDPTAKDRGRLTLNPIRHIDPFGLLMMVVLRVGWAKPVPVDMRYFKNPRRDMALVAVAGPAYNFALALVGMALVKLTLYLPYGTVSGTLCDVLFYMAMGSTALGIFNLFPIPPLDGSKIAAAALPVRYYAPYMRFERFGMPVVLALAYFGLVTAPLQWLLEHCADFYFWLFQI